MKHLILFFLILPVNLYSDFICDDIAKTLITEGNFSSIISKCKADLQLLEKSLKELEESLQRSKNIKEQKKINHKIINIKAEFEKAKLNIDSLQKKSMDFKIHEKLKPICKNVLDLHKKVEDIKKKISQHISNGVHPEKASKPHSREINSLRNKLAGEKAKIRDIIGLA